MIERCLRKLCGDIFIGVFACDELPKNTPKPALMVCNTDAGNLPGEHWISIFIDRDGRGEFFDSFGREPGHPFSGYMDKHCYYWTYNDRQLQSVLSSFCGQYCVFYCYRRSRGMNMNAIVNLFSGDTALNDYLVHKFVCRR